MTEPRRPVRIRESREEATTQEAGIEWLVRRRDEDLELRIEVVDSDDCSVAIDSHRGGLSEVRVIDKGSYAGWTVTIADWQQELLEMRHCLFEHVDYEIEQFRWSATTMTWAWTEEDGTVSIAIRAAASDPRQLGTMALIR